MEDHSLSEKFYLLGHNAEKHVASIFRVEEQAKQETSMKHVASSSSEMSLQPTTWRYISEDRTLHNHRCENFESYMPCLPASQSEVVPVLN
jgi:hypothetical protein